MVNLIENRLSSISTAQSDRPSVFLSVEALRTKSGNVVEFLTHILTRSLKVATAKQLRFGAVHSSVGSLAASFLSLSTPIRSTLNATNVRTIHHNGISSRRRNAFLPHSTFLHFGTHIPAVIAPRKAADVNILPLASFYERSGHLVTLDGARGRVRSHPTTVTAPVEARSLDVI